EVRDVLPGALGRLDDELAAAGRHGSAVQGDRDRVRVGFGFGVGDRLGGRAVRADRVGVLGVLGVDGRRDVTLPIGRGDLGARVRRLVGRLVGHGQSPPTGTAVTGSVVRTTRFVTRDSNSS